jgi:hypothetical protein
LLQDFDLPESVTASGTSHPLNTVVQEDVYRIAREAFTNALRHAQASTIAIEVGYSESALKIRVWDNGLGWVEHLTTADSDLLEPPCEPEEVVVITSYQVTGAQPALVKRIRCEPGVIPISVAGLYT